ncbi:glucose-fructose oxidoreductase [Algoriphagus ratkowskyi]|uniref:Gfo/Idh/MocA family oxidoreductase n=1 Tax=Algoriphagus ratkowskyi TaxID=57028 RepID=A0A2W7RB41_9BACT|nr:Gfo/Idh/MocA family oxidoreductase [Algoriphagus ratkowskyi]PZX57734.1 glucose-fructose oxidoreductase [Algoriphagus ratkowskyi]TXD79001.1 Gfo/Idh/MocA family oxidoreductase [Algoriphagus ratkowskyi]
MSFISRRTTLKSLALGVGVSMSSPFSVLSSTKSRKDKLGVALVGLGYYSNDLLAPALEKTENCYLAGIVTGTPSKAAVWKAKYRIPEKNIYNYETFDTIAENPDIDVIYIVLPPSMHKEYVIRAAKAGKHVWCEKPMAVTVEDCQAMIDACKQANVSLSIGYRCQHEPNTLAYQKIVQEKSLGKVMGLDCAAGYRENRTDHWKQKAEMGGGVIYDMGVYAIQGARLGSGMEPIAVNSAKVWTERPAIYKDGLGEIVEAELEFPGGVIGTIKTSFGDNMNFLTINCENGMIEMAPFSAYAGNKGQSPLGEINFPFQLPMEQVWQMDNDAQTIMERKPQAVPGEEGLRDIRIVEAILESAKTGKRILI